METATCTHSKQDLRYGEPGSIPGGLALPVLLAAVSRDAAWSLIRAAYLPGGLKCSGCGAEIKSPKAQRAWVEMRKVYCVACDQYTRPTIGTPLYQTSWTPEAFVRLLILTASGWNAPRIAAALGKSAACVRDMLDRYAAMPPADINPNQGVK